jgi:hypothetical protein
MKPEAKSDPEKTLSPQARATFSRAPYVHCWRKLTQQGQVTQREMSFDLLWVEQSKRLVSTR